MIPYIYLYPRAQNYCEQLQRYTKIKKYYFHYYTYCRYWTFDRLSPPSRKNPSRERERCSHQTTKNQQDVEQVKNAIKDFNIDSESIIDDWKKIQELKPTTDAGKKTLTDFLTSTADKVTKHYTEKALKLDIKDSDSQFQDKQKLETTITSLQKIIDIIKNINSASDQVALEEKTKPIQELISKFQKQVETLTKKEEQKSNHTETTSNVQGVENYNSEDSNYTPTYTESYGSINNSQAPATEQSSSGSTSSGGDNGANTVGQTADSSGSQSESNDDTTSSSN